MKNTSPALQAFSYKLLKQIGILFFSIIALPSLGNSLSKPDSIETNAPSQAFDIQIISPFLGGVQGMAMNAEGVLYYADTYSRADDISKVYMLYPPYTGKPVPTAIKGFSITGLMWQDEKLYVAFLNTNEIIIYDKNLEFLESRPINSPMNFASNGESIYVLSYFGNVGTITSTRVKIYVENLYLPFDILYSGHESLWVSEKGKDGAPGTVSEIAYEGVIINTMSYKFKEPAGLGMDDAGNIYVADKKDSKIIMVTPEGIAQVVSDKYAEPVCIIKMPDGRMMVNSGHNGGSLLLINPLN